MLISPLVLFRRSHRVFHVSVAIVLLQAYLQTRYYFVLTKSGNSNIFPRQQTPTTAARKYSHTNRAGAENELYESPGIFVGMPNTALTENSSASGTDHAGPPSSCRNCHKKRPSIAHACSARRSSLTQGNATIQHASQSLRIRDSNKCLKPHGTGTK